jgi:tRNA modification GTPase
MTGKNRMNNASHLSDIRDTICALATPPGFSAIAVIRISGKEAFNVCEQIFHPKNKMIHLSEAKSHTLHFGIIKNGDEILDEVLVSIFREPHSYTGENAIEISCHGSDYIQQKIIELLIDKGLRLAIPGEFTLRAFLNGKYDLSQAEAVADLISAHSKSSHDLALDQMRGTYSDKIKELRRQMINFTSLLELELDFSEEDVEFANRGEFDKLLSLLTSEVQTLIESFSIGNVLKKGIPVAIIGQPNVGKSTLLNAILNEERAIVSEIPGTTRDTIEDTLVINGISFRFIDTAGLRASVDAIESIGIERTYQKIDQAKIILYVFDVSATGYPEIGKAMDDFHEHIRQMPENFFTDKKFILIANKTDLLLEAPEGFKSLVEMDCIFVSAKRKENINLILESLSGYVENEKVSDSTIVSNTRHFEALQKTNQALQNIKNGFTQKLSSDLIAIDVRQALFHLGEITGEVTNNEILENIFSKFCIGK